MQGDLINSTDIYALGITTIEALTGIAARNIKSAKGKVQWPDDLQINPNLKNILEKMVEGDYRNRSYQEANQVLNDLNNLDRNLSKGQLFLIILAVIALASLVGFVIATIRTIPPSPTPSLSPTTPSLTLSELPSFFTSNLITSLDVTADGKTVILGHENGKISRWDINKQQNMSEFIGHNNSIIALTISADGQRLATASKEGEIKLWNPQIEQNIYNLNNQDAVTALAITPDGKTLVIGGHSSTIKIWNLQPNQGELMMTPSVSNGIESLAINQDASIIIGGNYRGKITIWERDMSSPDKQYLPQSNEIGKKQDSMYVSLSLDGQTMASSSCSNMITIIKRDPANQTRQPVRTKDDICLVTMSPDGKLVAGLSLQGNLIIWDIMSQREIRRFSLVSGNQAPVKKRLITFSDDGSTLVVALDSTVRVWRLSLF